MASPRELTTNDLIDLYSRRKKPPKLTVMKLDRETVLIEGDPAALEFLGRYIVAHSHGDKNDCGNGLDPRGAGSVWFTKDSTLGFYLHRLPCPDGMIARERLRKKRKTK